jgi:Na+/H+-dicarboxylate symporter
MKLLADIIVKLLRMTVLPCLTISIIPSPGNLRVKEARRLGVRTGTVPAMLWAVVSAMRSSFRRSILRDALHRAD